MIKWMRPKRVKTIFNPKKLIYDKMAFLLFVSRFSRKIKVAINSLIFRVMSRTRRTGRLFYHLIVCQNEASTDIDTFIIVCILLNRIAT